MGISPMKQLNYVRWWNSMIFSCITSLHAMFFFSYSHTTQIHWTAFVSFLLTFPLPHPLLYYYQFNLWSSCLV